MTYYPTTHTAIYDNIGKGKEAKLKYYYKSPEQVREDIQARQLKFHPYRNRTFRLVFLNILLVLAVMAAIYYTVGFPGQKSSSRTVLLSSGLEVSWTVAWPHDGDSRREFFLKIKNNTHESIEFPSREGNLKLEQCLLVVEEDSKEAFIVELHPERRIIAPGEIELYSFSPALDDHITDQKRVRYKFIIKLKNSPTITIPMAYRDHRKKICCYALAHTQKSFPDR